MKKLFVFFALFIGCANANEPQQNSLPPFSVPATFYGEGHTYFNDSLTADLSDVDTITVDRADDLLYAQRIAVSSGGRNVTRLDSGVALGPSRLNYSVKINAQTYLVDFDSARENMTITYRSTTSIKFVIRAHRQ